MKYTVKAIVIMEVDTDNAFQAVSLAARQLAAPPLAGVKIEPVELRVTEVPAKVVAVPDPEHYPFPLNPDEHHSPHFSTYDKGSCMCNCPQCSEQHGAGNCICPWCQDSSHAHGAR